MANLNTAIDSAFWDQNISTPHTLDGTARSVPGEPFPVDGSRASRVHRIQQLSLLREGFPLGIIPSIAPASDKKLGSFSFHSLFFSPSSSDWWLGLVGQFRPKKLISDIKAEITNAEEWDLQIVKDTAKHIIDKSLYSIGLWTQIALGSSSSLLLSTERHGDTNGFRNKFTFVHPRDDHDVTLEAAWPELFIDHKGHYWEVPESISFDVSSLVPESGLRYRFGLHSNRGQPRSVNDADYNAPPALMPGLCSKAAVSYKVNRDFWRQKEGKDDERASKEDDDFDLPPYDERLKEPHSAISGLIGGSLAAWITGRDKKRSPISADLFGSACYTFQKGQFRKNYRDLTRVDARVDICSASALAKKVFQSLTRSSANDADDSLWSPRLKLIFIQQIAGPIVFRVDSQFKIGSGAQMEDVILSLNYSLRLLESGKVVAWYSPKRKEGMIEVKVLEF